MNHLQHQPTQNAAVTAWQRRSRIYRKLSDTTVITDSPASRTPCWIPLDPLPPQQDEPRGFAADVEAIVGDTNMTSNEKALKFLDVLGEIGSDITTRSSAVEGVGKCDIVQLADTVSFCARAVIAVDLVERATLDAAGSLTAILATVRDAARSLEARACTLLYAAT